ncbi:hypothetical protein A4R28_30195 [Mesorhizobium ciceri]|nr:hypothetical protein A4R28_30195 [Mesorhizobium ciceri]
MIARVEFLDRTIRVVERIGPGARRVHRKGAVAVVSCPAGTNRLERVRQIVDVGIRQRAADTRGAIDSAAGLDDRAGNGAGDYSRVIGAVDRDRYYLGRAVLCVDGKRLGEMLADVETLHCRIVVVEGEGPDTTRGHLVGPIPMIARGSGRDRLERIGRVVDVGICQRAAHRRRPGDGIGDTASLDDRARRDAGNHRGVVGAGEMYRRGCPAERSIAEPDRVDEAVSQVLSRIQAL